MTILRFKDGKQCYIDGGLYKRLGKTKKRVRKDEDRVYIFDGQERIGKSTFAQQVARALDPSFNHERMCMTVTEFRQAIDNANPHQAIVFDEGFRGFSSRNTMTSINKVLITQMMEIGQKNLFILIVLPSVFMLEKYVVLHRASGLFHIYKNHGRRGFWRYYNKQRLKGLYLKGAKMMVYNGKGFPGPNFRGRFLDNYVIDRDAYRKKKAESLRIMELEAETSKKGGNKWTAQRNMLIKIIKEKYKMTNHEVSNLCEEAGFKLDPSGVSRALDSIKYGFGK